MDKELKPCPFCGENGGCICNYKEDRWVLDHFCKHDGEELSIVITIYGKSKQEIIEKWNKR